MSDTVLFLGSGRDGLRLEDLAAGVFRALGLSQSEERESSNYPPNDHYFAGYAQNACIHVYDADDDTKPEFPFRVSIQPPRQSGLGMVETDPKCMACLLAGAGFHVFIPHGDWFRADWNGEGDVCAG